MWLVPFLIVGFILWYFLYGMEIMLNGGDVKNLNHLKYLWEEIQWILLADSLPGIGHFLIMHILIPCSCLILYSSFYLFLH